MNEFQLNELQKKLLNNMLTVIDGYNSSSVSFSRLVNDLEGLLISGDFNEQFTKDWYNHWQNLEIFNAIKGDSVDKKDVTENLGKMRNWLSSFK